MRRVRWLWRLLVTRPRVYRDPLPELPLWAGGADWLGLRLGPWWIEWCWNRKPK